MTDGGHDCAEWGFVVHARRDGRTWWRCLRCGRQWVRRAKRKKAS